MILSLRLLMNLSDFEAVNLYTMQFIRMNTTNNTKNNLKKRAQSLLLIWLIRESTGESRNDIVCLSEKPPCTSTCGHQQKNQLPQTICPKTSYGDVVTRIFRECASLENPKTQTLVRTPGSRLGECVT